MGTAVSVRADALASVWQRKVVKTNPQGAKTECVLTEGNSILVSNFVASFIRAGDELLFPLEHEAVGAGTQIYIRKTNPDEKRRDVFPAGKGFALAGNVDPCHQRPPLVNWTLDCRKSS